VVGSPSVRQHLAGSRGLKPEADLAARSLGKLADYGAAKNVLVLLENDAAINEDPFLVVNIIEKVNNPYLWGLPDIGNSLAGGTRTSTKEALPRCSSTPTICAT